MSQTSFTRRAKLSRPDASDVVLSQSDEAFRAECDALSMAVAENLDPDLRTVRRTQMRGVANEKGCSGSGPETARVAAAKPVYYPGEMEFVPAYSFIQEHAGADRQAGDGADEVTISRQLLEFLLRCVLDRMDFDELQYLKCNPDVAAAVKRREMHSGREHFIKSGYFEGRSGGVRVDEVWYLARNPDVAAAKKAGKFLSGSAQYRLAGASEWRAPNPQTEVSVGMWKRVLKR